MLGWFRDLDRILRGEATRLPALRRGTVEIPAAGVSLVLVLLAMGYGACMGTFAVTRGGLDGLAQLAASVVKLPLLFALTLAVTFPSLYVFNALAGSRLAVGSALRLLIATLAITVTVLASLGPIVAFFSVSTTSYPFMLLLNVAVFVVAGLLGLGFLLQTMHRLSLIEPAPPPPFEPVFVGSEKASETERVELPPGALEPVDDRAPSRHVRTIFRCWVLLFGLVGAQMGWVLRPFVGNPAVPFAWLRPRESNVFQGIMNALAGLFS